MLRLAPKAQAKLARALDLLEEYGPQIGQPYVKAIAGRKGLWELRVSLGSDTFRLFFFHAGGRLLVIVHGVTKKGQRIPSRDLDVSEQRMATFLRRQR